VSNLESTPLTPVRYSLQSRDLIADQVETAAGGHWLDGMVVIPGCDKNMPGTLIALGRLNRPGMMVYGGTIRPGQCGGNGGPPEVVDIVSAFQSYGRYLQEGQTEAAEKTRYETVRNACPGAGACGGVSLQRNNFANCRCTRQTPWLLPSRPSACVFPDPRPSLRNTPTSSPNVMPLELPCESFSRKTSSPVTL
jgi:hypothetical protein